MFVETGSLLGSRRLSRAKRGNPRAAWIPSPCSARLRRRRCERIEFPTNIGLLAEPVSSDSLCNCPSTFSLETDVLPEIFPMGRGILFYENARLNVVTARVAAVTRRGELRAKLIAARWTAVQRSAPTLRHIFIRGRELEQVVGHFCAREDSQISPELRRINTSVLRFKFIQCPFPIGSNSTSKSTIPVTGSVMKSFPNPD